MLVMGGGMAVVVIADALLGPDCGPYLDVVDSFSKELSNSSRPSNTGLCGADDSSFKPPFLGSSLNVKRLRMGELLRALNFCPVDEVADDDESCCCC